MRNGLLGSLAGLFLGARLLFAQAPPPAEELPKPDKTAPAEELPKPGKSVPAAAAPSWGPLDRAAAYFKGEPSWVHYGGGHFWTSAEFLIWWVKDPRPFPELVSTGAPVPPEEGQEAGAIALGFGTNSINYKEFAGTRVAAGYWFDQGRTYGVDASFLFLGKRSLTFLEDDRPILTRPFFDLNNRIPFSIVVAAPGVAAGGITVNTTSRTWGMESNVWRNLLYDPPNKMVRVDVLAGFRYLDLAEDLIINRNTFFNPDLTASPRFRSFEANNISESDSFRTHNQFYGAQAGVAMKVFGDCCVLDFRAKVAAGVNQQRVDIRGLQTRTRPDGTTTVAQAGLLALGSNSGKHRREQFSYIPELSLTMGIPIGPHFGVYGGYNFIYWSKVARPGDQVDRVLDVTQIPNFPPPQLLMPPSPTGIARPAVPFTQAHWWAQGVTVGLEFNW